MRKGFAAAALLAAGLAGCGATPVQHRNDRDAPIAAGQGAFGDSLTWEWRRKDSTSSPAAAPANAAEQEEYRKWRESAGSSERKDFDDWRAWQEWKRKNPK